MLKIKAKDFITDISEEEIPKLRFKPTVKCVLSFIIGFLLMNPFITGNVSPFSISIIAAFSGVECIAATVGAAIGSFVFFDATDTVKYIAVALFACMINKLCEKYFDSAILKFVPYINSFCSIFLISTAIMLATGFELETFVTIIYESSLCCVGAYIISCGSALIFGKKEMARFSTKELVISLLDCGILMMPFYKYELLNFSFVGMIFSFLILCFGRLKRTNGGVLAGVCFGICMGLSNQIGFLSIGYALAGFLCGELSRKNKYFSAGGFICCIAICALIDSSLKAIVAIPEALAAGILFVFVPDRLFFTLSEIVNLPTPVYIKSDGNRILNQRLNAASTAITELSNCVNTVQRTLAPNDTKELQLIVKSAWCGTCADCELRESCRNEIKIPTDEAIEKIARALKSHAELDELHFPKGFSQACYSFDEMLAKIKLRHLGFVASLGARGKIEQMQGLMSDQFKSMADILGEIACEFDEDANINSDISDICSKEATEHGLNVLSSECFFDKFGRIMINLHVSRPKENFDFDRFTTALSMVTGASLEFYETENDGDEYVLKFKPMLAFEVEIGAFSRSADDIKVCGDYYRSFRDSNGRHITVLSDGMGTGSRAAVDSAMAAELFSKLVKSELSFDCALPIANSALLVKSSEESLATLDVICIDLYTGRTDFMKAGAAASFIRHRDSVAALEQSSLPIGILRDIGFSKATAKLESGDLLLMVSDGILGDCNGWIQQELKLWDMSKSPRELAEFIVNSACERKLGKQRDDMTAIALYINHANSDFDEPGR